MFLSKNVILDIFKLEAEAAELLVFYSTFIVGSYLLFALQLAANPVFTALRHPGFATISNVTRDLVLALPLIFLFAAEFGAKGVLAGQAMANALAGILAFSAAMWLARKTEMGQNVDTSWSGIKLHHHRHVIPGIQHRGH